jgi:hypothetical protein
MYGKSNRILYSAELSQGFKVVAAERTWQTAGVRSGGTKVGVIGRGNLNGRRRIVLAVQAVKSRSLRLADAMARQESSSSERFGESVIELALFAAIGSGSSKPGNMKRALI